MFFIVIGVRWFKNRIAAGAYILCWFVLDPKPNQNTFISVALN